MPDLKTLVSQLEGDLEDLSRRCGLPQRTLERARAAQRLAGEVGLAALGPVRATPELEAFHRQQIEHWLQRELAGGALQVRSARNRHTVLVAGREQFQLRFLPDACRWLLFHKQQRAWWPVPPRRPCLSLTDWLGQVRQSLTGVGGKAR